MPLVSLHSTTEAVKCLRSCHLVIYPTETAYAIGADAANQKATRKIFQVKGRNTNKPLPLIVASLSMAERYCDFSKKMRSLVKKYWPGPLTIIAHIKSGSLSRAVTKKDKTVAVRVSPHPKARSLSKLLGRPIVSTSANISGHGNCYSPRSVKRFFSCSPMKIYFLSGGILPRRKPSTIVTIKNGKLIVLRRGSIKVAQES